MSAVPVGERIRRAVHIHQLCTLRPRQSSCKMKKSYLIVNHDCTHISVALVQREPARLVIPVSQNNRCHARFLLSDSAALPSPARRRSSPRRHGSAPYVCIKPSHTIKATQHTYPSKEGCVNLYASQAVLSSFVSSAVAMSNLAPCTASSVMASHGIICSCAFGSMASSTEELSLMKSGLATDTTSTRLSLTSFSSDLMICCQGHIIMQCQSTF